MFIVRSNASIHRSDRPDGEQRRLRGDLLWLNARLRALLSSFRKSNDEDSLKPFRGLVVSDDEAFTLMEDLDQWVLRADSTRQPAREYDSGSTGEPQLAEAEGSSRLDWVCRVFQLSREERGCLVASLAPELDFRYERVFAYLQDDLTRRAPGVGLLLDLIEPHDPVAARRVFQPGSNLLRWRFLQLSNRPAGEPCTLLAKGVHLDDRIVDYLLENDDFSLPDSRNRGGSESPRDASRWHAFRQLLVEDPRAGTPSSRLLVLSGAAGAGQRKLAAWLASELGLPMFWTDARSALREPGDPERAVREALLNKAALGVDGIEAGTVRDSLAESLSALAELAREHLPLTIFVSHGALPSPLPAWAKRCKVAELPLPDKAERLLLWQDAFAESGPAANHLPACAARYPLSAEQIGLVSEEFRRTTPSGTDGRSAERLRQLCWAQMPARVSGVIESDPRRTWDDLVLPMDVRAQLEEFCGQARHRSTVLGHWGFDRKLSGGKGLHALFAGPPGTGKTLAAEVIAWALGRVLWRIDLSQTVSKFIGETEKNLDRVFRAAANVEAVLFFDEADALFGKRSEVKDAHDRFANQEVSYLLQQMDEYEGVAVLATNLMRNLDEAFVRRLQFIIEFPFPDEEQRLGIWQTVFPEEAPRAANLDLPTLARHVRLSGGHIRNIALAAAFAAADGEGVISMSHLLHAAHREYQKVGQAWTPPATTAGVAGGAR